MFFASSVFTLSSVPEYVPHLSFASPSGYGLNENENEKRLTIESWEQKSFTEGIRFFECEESDFWVQYWGQPLASE